MTQARVVGWLRNGVTLNTSVDTNFIVSSSGNLLILQVRSIELIRAN